ncbi:MAG: MBL fold metallo-hydrolase [Kangiellaceae bacterium]|nr:MBL fold metallo-hydrolase [Kangiellaceae bacterium]MCW8998404.1 MBL fold metallo-hydrolase [Kangiellaceae bacterium]MCW9018086.1 MBL fold metallo-hydrolase [Kangiellaceae bacterium]
MKTLFQLFLVAAACLINLPVCGHTQRTTIEHESEAIYLGNEGVLVVGKETKIFFDPFFHNHYGSYTLVPEKMRNNIFSGTEPFNDIDAIFVSHIHGDHFDAKDTVKYSKLFPKTRLFVPSQAIQTLREINGFENVSSQVIPIKLQFGDQPVEFKFDAFGVEAVFIPHAGWPRTKDVQNIVYRVSAKQSFTVAHFGDADSNPEFYMTHKQHWQKIATDLAFVPFWLGLSDQGISVISEIINSKKNIGVHVPTKVPQTLEKSSLDYFAKPGESRKFKN